MDEIKPDFSRNLFLIMRLGHQPVGGEGLPLE